MSFPSSTPRNSHLTTDVDTVVNQSKGLICWYNQSHLSRTHYEILEINSSIENCPTCISVCRSLQKSSIQRSTTWRLTQSKVEKFVPVLTQSVEEAWRCYTHTSLYLWSSPTSKDEWRQHGDLCSGLGSFTCSCGWCQIGLSGLWCL